MGKNFHKGSVKLNLKAFQKIQDGAEQAVRDTISDLQRNAASKVAKEVTAVYSINKKELIPGSVKRTKNDDGSTSSKKVKQAGSIRITGERVDGLVLTYKGRRLTPTHFKMSPASPPASGVTRVRKSKDGKKRTDKGGSYQVKSKSYTLTMQVHPGQKRVIGRYASSKIKGSPGTSHNILMGTGNLKAEGVDYIPFQRTASGSLKKFLTVSVPQMITNDTVYPAIVNSLNEYSKSRLEHHMKRRLKK